MLHAARHGRAPGALRRRRPPADLVLVSARRSGPATRRTRRPRPWRSAAAESSPSGSDTTDRRAQGPEHRRPRRQVPPRRPRVHRLPHAHDDAAGFDLLALDLRNTKDSGGFHARGRGVREEQAGGAVADRRRLGPQAVDAAGAPDEGDARSGHGRPSDLPLAAQDGHMMVCNSLALKLAGDHRGDAGPAGRRHRERREGRADGHPQGRSDGPRLDTVRPAAHRRRDDRRARGRDEERGAATA